MTKQQVDKMHRMLNDFMLECGIKELHACFRMVSGIVVTVDTLNRDGLGDAPEPTASHVFAFKYCRTTLDGRKIHFEVWA